MKSRNILINKLILTIFFLWISLSSTSADTSVTLMITSHPSGARIEVYQDGVEVTYGSSITPSTYYRFASGNYIVKVMMAGYITQLIPVSLADTDIEIGVILEKNTHDSWHHIADEKSEVEFIGFDNYNDVYGVVFHVNSVDGREEVVLLDTEILPIGTYIYFPETREIQPYDRTHLEIPSEIINQFLIQISTQSEQPLASSCGNYIVALRQGSNHLWLIDTEKAKMQRISESEIPSSEIEHEITQVKWVDNCSALTFREIIGYSHTLIVVTIPENIDYIEKFNVLEYLQDDIAISDVIGTYLISASPKFDQLLITSLYSNNNFSRDIFDLNTRQLYQTPMRVIFSVTWLEDRLIGIGTLVDTFLFEISISEITAQVFDVSRQLIGISEDVFISPDAQYLAFYVDHSQDSQKRSFMIYSLDNFWE
jgi:hypothetical protein